VEAEGIAIVGQARPIARSVGAQLTERDVDELLAPLA
jgi:hypothetical protein